MPGSALWKRVSAKYLTPAPAVWLSAFVALAATVSGGAYAVVTSISVIGLYFSYIIPVYLAWRARGTTAEVPRGPWHLGRYGWTINLVSILWVIFIAVILGMPDNMRAGRAMLGLTLLLAVWYFTRERYRFGGPAWASARLDAASHTRTAGETLVSGG
jgi:L-asparagine transporter-like permease